MGGAGAPRGRTALGRAQSLTRAALAAFLACAPHRVEAQEATARVESIEIVSQNVFSPEEAASALIPYRLANALHATTRRSLIERALLFRVGDPLDPDLLEESERDLRALRLFRRVKVRAEGTRAVVETADTWTLLPRMALSRRGGVLTYSFGLEEQNALGTGRQVGFRYDKGTERISKLLFYSDPNLFEPYTLLQATASDLSDGRTADVRLGRPFYAIEAEHAWGVAYRHARFEDTLYARGEESAKWRERDRLARIEGGFRLDHVPAHATRLVTSVEWTDVALEGAYGPPPPPEEPRRFLFVSAGLEREGRSWIERRQVDLLERDEDFNLAPSWHVELGVSPSVEGSRRAARGKARFTSGTSFRSGFALAALSAEARYEDGPRNALLAAELRGYVLRRRLTLVARLAALAGGRLDPEQRVELDGESGVRGYHLHAVNGTRRAVGNLEARVFVLPEILHLVSLGAAAFLDAGVSGGPPDGTWRLADAGVGLRFGLTRASKNTLVRVDVARALHADPLGRTGWLVSFSSGQAF